MRTDLTFQSDGTACAAWHYRADRSGPRACVVLAHGFSMVRDAGLQRYGARFASAGFDALVFDYRSFGASAGEPRQLLDVHRQLADWRAAVACARTLPDVERIVLWGTSFSGGHVAAIAAADRGVAGVISQVPFSGLGGREEAGDRRHQLRMVVAALKDRFAGPRHIKVAAPPGEFAAFNVPGATEQIEALTHESTTWENRFTPRVVLQMATYKPFANAAQIDCPWLLQVCVNDRVTPERPAIARAIPATQLTVRRHECEHFEVYAGESFERMVAEQLDFLRALEAAEEVRVRIARRPDRQCQRPPET